VHALFYRDRQIDENRKMVGARIVADALAGQLANAGAYEDEVDGHATNYFPISARNTEHWTIRRAAAATEGITGGEVFAEFNFYQA
jgi:hypothetical protein